MLEAKRKIGTILFGERWDRQRNTGQINALMLSQRTAIHDFTFHVTVADPRDPQLDQSIGQQNPRPRIHFFCQAMESRGDQLRCAISITRRDSYRLPGLERNGLASL